MVSGVAPASMAVDIFAARDRQKSDGSFAVLLSIVALTIVGTRKEIVAAALFWGSRMYLRLVVILSPLFVCNYNYAYIPVNS
jgi:hypothetical protein